MRCRKNNSDNAANQRRQELRQMQPRLMGYCGRRRRIAQPPQRCDQLVAAPRIAHDIILAQRLAQPRYLDRGIAGLDMQAAPDDLQKLFRADDLAVILDQHEQDADRAPAQLDDLAISDQAAPVDIQNEVTDEIAFL